MYNILVGQGQNVNKQRKHKKMTDMLVNSSEHDGYQVLVVNIKYKKVTGKQKERPDSITLDVPEGILKCKNDKQKFFDNVEQFVYNTISQKYGAEVTFCQTWLPLED